MNETNHKGFFATLKLSHIVCFLFGVLFMASVNTLRGSDAQSATQPQHVFELRMYHANPGKIDALVARFRDHTDALFARHNMKSIGYWQPEDAPDSQNLFIYILEHPSREDAKKNWAAFHADPEWKKVKADSEVNGVLIDHIDDYFMDPTNFSPLK
jgi:hypothetical protein